MDQITPAAAVQQFPELWNSDHQREAEIAERVRQAASTFFHRSGLIGGSIFTITELSRSRRRSSRRGSARTYADLLRRALDARAAQRRARAVKGHLAECELIAREVEYARN